MLDSFKLAYKSIKSNKTRSFLTMLGIIIGVSSVIILVSIVSGYMNYTVDSFLGMGANEISVHLNKTGPTATSASNMVAFCEDNSSVFSYMTPLVRVNKDIRLDNIKPKNTMLNGVSDSYQKMKDYKIAVGRFISYSDVETRQKVVVIGDYCATLGYGNAEQAIGNNIQIEGTNFKIIGVVQKMDDGPFTEYGKDNFCLIPYSTACGISNIGSPTDYTYVVNDPSLVSTGLSMLDSYLNKAYKDPQAYSVSAMNDMLSSMNSQIQMLSVILGGIAGISLLVAGVGVMNIMLVTVRERTREIGIRKAVGAKRKAILQQFLIEAAVTSFSGGLIGVIIGSAISIGFGKNLLGVPTPPTPGAVLASFAVSVAIGLIFGYAPANRAAKMKPIVALQSI